MLKGNDVIILKDGVAIAAARSCDIHVGAAADEVSSASTGTWRERLLGRKDWTVSVSMLVTGSLSDILTAAGGQYTLSITNRNDASDRLTGTALLTDARLTAVRGSLAQGSWVFTGNGALT